MRPFSVLIHGIFGGAMVVYIIGLPVLESVVISLPWVVESFAFWTNHMIGNDFNGSAGNSQGYLGVRDI